MADDRRTKAQILEELEKVQAENDRLHVAMPTKPSEVPAATALAGCIRALDRLNDREKRNSYGTYGIVPASDVEDVLRHLVRRYHVDLTERTVEPCNRRHLDDAADGEILDRLRGMGGF